MLPVKMNIYTKLRKGKDVPHHDYQRIHSRVDFFAGKGHRIHLKDMLANFTES